MVYIQNGERVVGFDNERGKGDHMHLDGKEYPYQFTNLDQLIEDFLFEVEKRRRS
ncbi:peptidylprolyl isomerase [Brucella tritici]|uniref:Peptidylprolyl isomerase n=2 Tax=Brucella TaxID=234 RepID=A0A7V8B3Z6_9HYPH|nr:peptidylprolyl isomerase [Brucella tritici]